MCQSLGHRFELDHCPLALKSLFTHSFSNIQGALLCVLARWGLVLGVKRAWLAGEGVNWTHRSRLCIWEEQEPGENAVGPIDAYQGVLVGGLQEDGLPQPQLEHDAAHGDLEGVVDIVAEGEHLLCLLPAPHEVYAQVPSRAGMVGEVVEARHPARELAVSILVVVVGVGDHVVEADDLVPPQGAVDGACGREGDFLRGLVVS